MKYINTSLGNGQNIKDLQINLEKQFPNIAGAEVWNAERTTKFSYTDLLIIKELIQLGVKKITPSNSATFFLGYTGNGKSTLLNYLINAPLIIKKEKGKYIIKNDEKSQEQFPKIGESVLSSETTVPNKIEYENFIFWDCPGFSDTKGPVQDVPNAFYIQRLFEITKNIRILIVVSYQIMDDKTLLSNFLKLMMKIGNMFKNEKNKADCITLVITKTPLDVTLDDFYSILNDAIVDARKIFKGFNKENEEFLRILTKPGKTTFFHCPEDPDPCLTDIDRKQIWNTIKQSKSCCSFKPTIILDPESLNMITELKNQILENLENDLYYFYQSVLDSFREKVQENIDQSLFLLLSNIFSNFLKGVVLENLKENIQNIVQSRLKTDKMHDVFEKLMASITFGIFLNEIHPLNENLNKLLTKTLDILLKDVVGIMDDMFNKLNAFYIQKFQIEFEVEPAPQV